MRFCQDIVNIVHITYCMNVMEANYGGGIGIGIGSFLVLYNFS